MPEQEPQFFKPGEIAGKKSEEEKEAEFLKGAEPSKEMEPLIEEGRKREERAVAEAEKILTEDREMSGEEKIGAIKSYLEASFVTKEMRKTPVLERMREAEKKFLLELKPDEFEKILGEKETHLVYKVISERDILLDQMRQNGVELGQLMNFIAAKGGEEGVLMLPRRIGEALDKSSLAVLDLNILFSSLRDTARSGDWGFSEDLEEIKKLQARQLKVRLADLRAENNEWKKYSEFEREREEKPIKVKGFEKFDLPKIRGDEIIGRALEILPHRALSTNVESVEYRAEIKKTSEQYGFSGIAVGEFAPQKEWHEISLFETPSLKAFGQPEKLRYLMGAPFTITHEYGHSLDPRIVDQKDLNPGEQLQMIIEWENVRNSEEEWSTYVKKINNKNRAAEESLKSQESFAESVAYYLTDPNIFADLHPKRYEFLSSWFKERFTDFNLGKSLRAAENYNTLMDSLREKEKISAEKLLKAIFEK